MTLLFKYEPDDPEGKKARRGTTVEHTRTLGLFFLSIEGETDCRAIHLSLTQPSRRLLAAYDAVRQLKLQQISGKFEPEELQHAAMLLDRLSAQIVDQSAEGDQMCLQYGIYFCEKCVLRKLLSRRGLYQRQKGMTNEQ
jgi:hypothetical protein